MVELPQELWGEIARYLEKKDTTPLLGVNQLLRSFALDRIYEQASVDLGELNQMEYLQEIGHLGYPSYATRIRKLSISTTRNALKPSTKSHIRQNLKTSARTSVDAISRFHDRLRGRKFSKSEIVQKLLLSFVNLKEVELFCVDDEEQEDFETHMPLLLSSLQTYSSTLTSIGFSIFSMDFLATFLTTLPTFPVLERLSLRLMACKANSQPLEFGLLLKDVVAAFISRHRQTLSFIQVIINSFSREYDFSMLFDNLEHIPHLKTLEIPFALNRLSTLKSFQRILKIHSETIEDLILFVPFNARDSHFTGTESQGPFASILTPLPRLKDLAIYSVMNAFHVVHHHPSTDLTNYISQYSSQLSRFVVYMRFFGSDDWKAFAGMDWNRLALLSLQVEVATPAVFDAFSSRFPALRSLSLVISAFQESFEAKSEVEVEGGSKKFCIQMSTRNYPKSSLTHLEMHHKNHEHHHPHRELRAFDMSCVGAVVQAFPSVVFVNDRPRTAFLQGLATLATSDSRVHRIGSRFRSR